MLFMYTVYSQLLLHSTICTILNLHNAVYVSDEAAREYHAIKCLALLIVFFFPPTMLFQFIKM